jgi:hypothetical protein
MQAVKVLKIGNPFKVNTQYGKKDKRFYTVKLNTGQEIEASCFISSKHPTLKEGDDCLMDISTSKGHDRDGNQKTYFNINSIELYGNIELPDPPKETQEVSGAPSNTKDVVPQGVWDRKDTCMRRMNSWAHAVEIVKASLGTQFEKEAIGEDTVFQLVQKIAHMIEEDINR